MMAVVQNFPFAAIMLYLAGGVTCCVLRPKASKRVCLALNILVTALMFSVLVFTVRSGESYVYWMGHFPAPWGNEIRIGPLEALMGTAFPLIMTLTLLGGMEHIFEDVEPDKINLYFTVVNLLMVSIQALVFTNDLFTAYVFAEINTIASCALVMLKYKSGRALVATTRYMIMSLLGSGLFLLGIVILYSITGHLLMQPMAAGIQELFASGDYAFPLTVTVGLFSVGMALKSALWPFRLIKIFYRILGPEEILSSGVTDVLFVFGIGAMICGSFYALKEKDIKRMLAYSSVAQVGYIYAGIGLGTRAGMLAACVQILVHAATKPMLFCTSGGLMSVSGGSRRFEDLRGAGRRDPLSGIAFSVGALSMIGIPLFAGFVTKLFLTRALLSLVSWKLWAGLFALVFSTVLNALYYLPAVSLLFGKRRDDCFSGIRASLCPSYLFAILVFIVLNLLIGCFSGSVTRIIETGLSVLS